MADHGRPFSQDTAYGCLTHYRFRHPDTREWMQLTRLEVAQVEQVFRYCGMRWNVQWVSCDQCQESSHPVQDTPLHMPAHPPAA
jgi:hypothetical protein